MFYLITALHVLISFMIVGVILLQSGKGAEMGAAFGGSSQTLFGSRGAATFLSKMTAVLAGLFFVTSLGLSVMTKGRFLATSVIDLKQKPAPTQEAPAPPAASGAEQAPEASAPAAPAEGQAAPPVPTPAAPQSEPGTPP